MGQPDQAGEGFWRTLPGILTAVAGVITALTGLLVAADQIGIFAGDSGESRQSRSTAAQEVAAGGDDLPDVQVTADGIAGTWVGRVARGQGETFVLRLTVTKGCARNERCGTITDSATPCKGEVYLDEVKEGKEYALSVDNFSEGSSASCTRSSGNYFTPQRNGTLRYGTGYDGSIAGTLSRAPG